MDPTSIAQRFADHKDSMVEQVEAKFAELAEVERKAKRVCETAGVVTSHLPFYLDFARQCYRISQKFSGATQINEVYFRYQYWISQGYTAAVLTDIAELCGVNVGAYPAP